MKLEDGGEVHADVLVGADGIWSQVRTTPGGQVVWSFGTCFGGPPLLNRGLVWLSLLLEPVVHPIMPTTGCHLTPATMLSSQNGFNLVVREEGPTKQCVPLRGLRVVPRNHHS